MVGGLGTDKPQGLACDESSILVSGGDCKLASPSDWLQVVCCVNIYFMSMAWAYIAKVCRGQRTTFGAGERARRALEALQEDLGSTPSSHMVAHNTSNCSSPGSSASWPQYVQNTHVHAGKILVCKLTIILFLKWTDFGNHPFPSTM